MSGLRGEVGRRCRPEVVRASTGLGVALTACLGEMILLALNLSFLIYGKGDNSSFHIELKMKGGPAT